VRALGCQAFVFVACVGAACTKHEDSQTRPDPPAATAPDAGAPPPEVGPQVGPASSGGTLGGKLIGKVLLPPTTAGESSSEVAGCLAAASEADAAKFPLSREAPAAPVTVSSLSNGLIITHELTHACCLKATVTSKLDKDEVTLREALFGTPCRCMCSSTLRTAVGLRAGLYRVHVVVEDNGKARPAIEVRGSVP
jgi:hypothetical protein